MIILLVKPKMPLHYVTFVQIYTYSLPYLMYTCMYHNCKINENIPVLNINSMLESKIFIRVWPRMVTNFFIFYTGTRLGVKDKTTLKASCLG